MDEPQPYSGARESGKPRHSRTRNPQHPSRKAATKIDKRLAKYTISDKEMLCKNREEKNFKVGVGQGPED